MIEHYVYLAGPISELTYEGATDWREHVRGQLQWNIIWLSPMRGKDYLKGEQSLPQTYDQSVLSTESGIMGRDMNDVRRSDMLLVNLLGAKRVSLGTMLEVGAAFILNKPIVLVMEPTGNPHEHPMLRRACAWRVPTVDEGIAVVKSVLGWD